VTEVFYSRVTFLLPTNSVTSPKESQSTNCNQGKSSTGLILSSLTASTAPFTTTTTTYTIHAQNIQADKKKLVKNTRFTKGKYTVGRQRT